jgi:hypothetical protein
MIFWINMLSGWKKMVVVSMEQIFEVYNIYSKAKLCKKWQNVTLFVMLLLVREKMWNSIVLFWQSFK